MELRQVDSKLSCAVREKHCIFGLALSANVRNRNLIQTQLTFSYSKPYWISISGYEGWRCSSKGWRRSSSTQLRSTYRNTCVRMCDPDNLLNRVMCTCHAAMQKMCHYILRIVFAHLIADMIRRQVIFPVYTHWLIPRSFESKLSCAERATPIPLCLRSCAVRECLTPHPQRNTQNLPRPKQNPNKTFRDRHQIQNQTTLSA